VKRQGRNRLASNGRFWPEVGLAQGRLPTNSGHSPTLVPVGFSTPKERLPRWLLPAPMWVNLPPYKI